MSDKYIEGKVIGQCKNCFYFCIYKHFKKQYIPKLKLFCQCPVDNVDIAISSDNPEYGCIHWKKRKSIRKVIIKV